MEVRFGLGTSDSASFCSISAFLSTRWTPHTFWTALLKIPQDVLHPPVHKHHPTQNSQQECPRCYPDTDSHMRLLRAPRAGAGLNLQRDIAFLTTQRRWDRDHRPLVLRDLRSVHENSVYGMVGLSEVGRERDRGWRGKGE